MSETNFGILTFSAKIRLEIYLNTYWLFFYFFNKINAVLNTKQFAYLKAYKESNFCWIIFKLLSNVHTFLSEIIKYSKSMKKYDLLRYANKNTTFDMHVLITFSAIY